MIGRARVLYWATRALVGSRTLLLFGVAPEAGRESRIPAVGEVFGKVPSPVLVQLAANRGAPVQEYARRLGGGHLLLLACDENQRPLASGWLTLPAQDVRAVPWEWNTTVQVSPGEGFLWDFHTVPRARGQGLYRGLLRRAVEYCADHGCQTLTIHCNEQNTASRRAILASGFRERATLLIARFGPFYAINGPSRRLFVWNGSPTRLDRLCAPG